MEIQFDLNDIKYSRPRIFLTFPARVNKSKRFSPISAVFKALECFCTTLQHERVQMADVQFPMAFRGYEKESVDAQIKDLLGELSVTKQNLRHRQQEVESARIDIAQLREKLKNNTNFGYADLGSQFEQTLRVAEEQAKKLIADASQESIRIRDTAQAEADQIVRKAEATVARMLVEAEQKVADISLKATASENAIKTQRAHAEQEFIEIKIQAQQEASEIVAAGKLEASRLRADASHDVESLRNETNRARIEAQDALVLAQANAADILAKANAQVLAERAAAIAELERITSQVTAKRNEYESTLTSLEQLRADTELELTEKRNNAEQEAKAMYAAAAGSAEETIKRAEIALDEANARAAAITSQAEQLLQANQVEAESLMEKTRRDTFHIIAEARSRAEALTSRAEGYALTALHDAEARVASLSDDYRNFSEFAETLKSLMSTEAIASIVEATALTNASQDRDRRLAAKSKFSGSIDVSEPIDAEVVSEATGQ